MFRRFKVSGDSMLPTLKNGQQIIAEKISCRFLNPKIGDIIILKNSSNINLVKRITKKDGGNYFIEGDNKEKSTDSKNFGPIQKNDILAKIIY